MKLINDDSIESSDNFVESEDTATDIEEVTIEETSSKGSNKAAKSGGKGKSKSKGMSDLFSCRTLNVSEPPFIETNQCGLDLVVSNGRGIPLGGFVSLFSPPGSGKTTILCDMLARVIARHKAMKIPFKAIYLDMEGSIDLVNAMGLGKYIESGDLIYIEKQVTFSNLEKLYNDILEGKEELKDVKFVIIDSITSVNVEAKLEKGVEEADFGVVAKAATEFFKRYVTLTRGKFTTFLINQVRDNQGATGMFAQKVKNALSNAGRHYSSIIMFLHKKVGESDKELQKVKIKTSMGTMEVQKRFIVSLDTITESLKCKGRFGRIPPVNILVEYGRKVINSFTIKNMLIGLGYVTLSGSYYSIAEGLPISNKGKKITRPELDKVVSTNRVELINFLKERNEYRITFEDTPDNESGYIE